MYMIVLDFNLVKEVYFREHLMCSLDVLGRATAAVALVEATVDQEWKQMIKNTYQRQGCDVDIVQQSLPAAQSNRTGNHPLSSADSVRTFP